MLTPYHMVCVIQGILPNLALVILWNPHMLKTIPPQCVFTQCFENKDQSSPW